MSKYLKLFENHTQYETFIGGGGVTPFVKPNVSYCTEENEVHYNPFSWADEYLTFDIVTEGTIVWKTSNSNNVKTISYSINNGEWAEITSSTTGVSFNVSVGDKVRFKGNNPAYGASTSSYNTFNDSTASFNVQGNIMSLTNGDSFANATTFEREYVFVYLFNNANIINAKNLVLSATTLASSCYLGMFRGCTSLVTAPTLSATTLASSCYSQMFYDCTGLTTAPELPATTLASSCYQSMFGGCTKLVNAPELPATTLADSCYQNMFYGCTSLVNAPTLPATTLANSCYQYMFCGCTNLVNAPTLPATTLASNCYSHMFDGCTSLVNAPTLPATTLANSCYSQMFYDCTNLTTAPTLPSTTLATKCYQQMFKGCTSLTTAPELPATTLESGCYGYMFYGCTSLTTAPELPATTLADSCYDGMFYGCSSLNYIKCLATTPSIAYTRSWVSGVFSSGTFVKAASMTSWETGISGIPSGWTIKTATV